MFRVPHHLSFCVGLTLALGAGCLSDDPEPDLGESTAYSEVVVDAPSMSVLCTGCFQSGHIIGDPVTISTSFYGYCRTPPFGTEYPCNSQPYALTIECLGVACDQDPAGGDTWSRNTNVIPLEAGPLTIRVRMNSNVVTFAPFESVVPDDLRVVCRTGSGYDQPCVAGDNPPRVRLTFELYRGVQRLYPTGRFELESNQAGLAGGNAHQDWYLSAPGLHRIAVSYGPVSRDYEVTVVTPPPPPPPPPPPVGRDVGRVPSAALSEMAPP